MSRTRIVGGKITEIIGGDYNIYSKGDITFNSQQQITETAKEGITYGEPESITVASNAFIPIVKLIAYNKDYNVKERDVPSNLDMRIDRDKRFDNMQVAQILSKESFITLKFKVEKGNKDANDDTGKIAAELYDHKNKKIETKTYGTSYGSTFELNIFVPEVAYIKFIADDNDLFFDGGVFHVFCGIVKIGDCQKDLIRQTAKTLHLTEEQKFLFKVTMLMESAGGVKELNDIAYIYLNLINDLGYKEGMNQSSAYIDRNDPVKGFMFSVYRYMLTEDIKYGQKKGYGKISEGLTAIEFIDKFLYTNEHKEQVKQLSDFIDKKIFCQNPETKYLGWYGQGNSKEDMNLSKEVIRAKNIERKKKRERPMSEEIAFVWERARQYYWLQKECKVKERLLVEFKCKAIDGTIADTCIYDKEKILKYFEENPSQYSHPVKEIPYEKKKL